MLFYKIRISIFTPWCFFACAKWVRDFVWWSTLLKFQFFFCRVWIRGWGDTVTLANINLDLNKMAYGISYYVKRCFIWKLGGKMYRTCQRIHLRNFIGQYIIYGRLWLRSIFHFKFFRREYKTFWTWGRRGICHVLHKAIQLIFFCPTKILN